MLNIKQTLKSIFTRQTPKMSLSSEDARGDTDPREQIIQDVIKTQKETGQVSGDHLKVIAAVFFHTEIEGPFYKLRDLSRYGHCFELQSVKLLWSKDSDGKRRIDDVMLLFIDGMMGSSTSATFSVSIKDLNDWMTPVLFPTLDKP